MLFQGKKPIKVIDERCSQIVEPLVTALADFGLRAVQTFDLRSTRAVHEGCTCPSHGTDRCTCEMTILLVYYTVGGPSTLVLDGRDRETFIYVEEENGSELPHATIAAIQSAIQKAEQLISIQETFVDVE